ncbi:MurR/RpiR family transcriptional regulator [Mitsuokella multacida]|uniref:MurR/RpiR family transcriptional regulator n=1 Tax=Mitsuokella multacida TaxID=52226 RepID=UPI0026E01F6A|nr:MurR/RpiR family transcriptional regulator [Mitsuokella multacida]
MNLIKELQEKKGFSDSEQTIATYLLNHSRELPSMTTRQLAQKTYTSSAAIVRFCQKLGFGGYTEFRVEFLTQMVQYLGNPHGVELAMTDRDSVHSILEKVTRLEIDALQETYRMLDPADFVRAFAILSKTSHVDFYAMDNNINIANMAASSFTAANKCSMVSPDMSKQYLQAVSAPKEHVGFLISRTGENRMLVDIARLLKKRGNPILLITGKKDSTIGALADVAFEVESVKKIEELGPRVFLMGAKYVTDILFAVLMTRVDFHEIQRKESWLSEYFYY